MGIRRSITSTLAVIGALVIATAVMVPGSARAAKPIDVIAWSNGYPSGPHFNLNIHGKRADFVCVDTPGGGSVFVLEYGADEIDIVMNRKSAQAELVAKDPCGIEFTGNDPVLVQLPAGEYQVYARVLAKPSKNDTERKVIFSPKLIEACNDTGTDEFADAVDCEDAFLLGTGVVAGGGFYDPYQDTFTRTAGRSKAVDITAAFQWTGWACDQSFDTNGDGEITVADALADMDGDGDVDAGDLALTDLDVDGDVDADDLALADLDDDGDVDVDDLALVDLDNDGDGQVDLILYLTAYLGTNCTYYDSEWVFNLADLVVYGWDYQNDGVKLLQVRFYPLSTTTFE